MWSALGISSNIDLCSSSGPRVVVCTRPKLQLELPQKGGLHPINLHLLECWVGHHSSESFEALKQMKAVVLFLESCVFQILFLLLVFFGSSSMAAQEWTEFRGPTGQGHASALQLPLHWSQSSHQGWQVTGPGKGWSSPIVHRGRLYLTTAVPLGDDQDGDQSLRALCLDAKTGKTLWDVEVFQQLTSEHSRIHRKNSHASPTPITDGERLYVHFGTQGTAALDLRGESLWKNRSLKFDNRHGNGGSPILSGDLLIFNCDGADMDRNDGGLSDRPQWEGSFPTRPLWRSWSPGNRRSSARPAM